MTDSHAPTRRAALLGAAGLGLFAPRLVRAQDRPASRSLRTDEGEMRAETILRGVQHPWGIAFLPDGRFLVTERNAGRVRIGAPDGRISAPVEGVPQVYRYEGPTNRSQGGLFDVVLAPDFAQSRRVALSYSNWTDQGGGTAVSVGRLVETGGQPRFEGMQRIFMQNNPDGSGLHFGGRMALHPSNETLYLAIGDRRNMNRSQDAEDHAGSIVRMRLDGSAPDDNPFVGEDDKDDHVWSYGHRNIQAMAFRPGEDSELWVADHGPQGGDEINRIRKGANFGWPFLTGGRDYSGAPMGEGTEKDGMVSPAHVWEETVGPSGLVFCTGERFPAWEGQMLVGSLTKRGVVRMRINGSDDIGQEEVMLTDLDRRIRDVKLGPDGALWLLTEHADGEVIRVRPA